MKITVEFTDDEVKEIFKEAVYKRVVDELYKQGNFTEEKGFRYGIRNIIKESIRSILKDDKEHLAKLSVEAAAVSIKNEAVKKFLKNQVIE
ncbi:MAG: hypothetical protein IKI40_06595 [Treponema sp.]|nr:hypothetical protein [Treponema sp.]